MKIITFSGIRHPRHALFALIVSLTLTACTSKGGLYTFKDDQKFSMSHTLGAIVAVAGTVAIARSGAAPGSSFSGNNEVSCNGTYCHDEVAWDYLPLADQYRCRITRGSNGGQFTDNDHCDHQRKEDNWT